MSSNDQTHDESKVTAAATETTPPDGSGAPAEEAGNDGSGGGGGKKRLNSYSAVLASKPKKTEDFCPTWAPVTTHAAPVYHASAPSTWHGRGPGAVHQHRKSGGDAGGYVKKSNYPPRDRHDSGTYNRRNSEHQYESRQRYNSTNNKNGSAAGGQDGHNNGSGIVKQRSTDKRQRMSTGKSFDDDEEHKNGKQRVQSTNSTNSKPRHRTSNSVNSNGESLFDEEDYDLDEPFTDSEDDSTFNREIAKPVLQIPRGRIRTLSGTVPPVGFSPKWGGPTMCLQCLEFFDLPENMEKFADHLLKEHHIVVEEMELIVDPKRYIEHWRQRFATNPIEDVFPKIYPNDDDPYHNKTDYYYVMGIRNPEDHSLRQRLAMRRLEEALSCQQRERDETTFSMRCIFCRYVGRNNRAKLIHHLYLIHHLNLGSPDNLVFVHEYIEHLRERIQRHECIYCEKLFENRNMLMDHMRKKNHREVNPKNDYYDKFYIINYLELGKRWLDVLAEDFEDSMPTFQDSDDEEEDLEWHEWQEDNMDEDQIRAVCLFCDDSYEKIQGILAHMNDRHKFDLIGVIEKEKLDFYGRMKLLNYFRRLHFDTPNYRAKPSDAGDAAVVVPERSVWDKEDELIPKFGNDHLLWMLEGHLSATRPELADKEPEPDASVPQLDRMIAESKANFVDTVIPEDLPALEGPYHKEIEQLAVTIRTGSMSID